MPHLIWSPQALTDIQRLYRFLATNDLSAGQRAIKAIRAGTKVIASHPHLGRPVHDMDPKFREWLVNFGSSGYVVLYCYKINNITILAIRHQKEVGY